MKLETALRWAAEHKNGVLITLRSDGRPQSSDIVYSVADGTFRISVTDSRAKTANMRRDPRVVLHLTDPSSWSYLSFDGTVELTPVVRSADDPTADLLVDYYETVAGKAHPDWDAYRRSLVEEGRLLATVTPSSVVGQVN